MALEDGCLECQFPMTVARDTLERGGYFEAFPDGAVALATGDGAYCLPPAVCYPVYAMLGGGPIVGPVRLTAANRCFREADRGGREAGRLWEFSMREVIFVGPSDWVAAERDRWSARIVAFASEIGLTASLRPATDPFFAGDIARGRHLLQQIKGLKLELCSPIGANDMAIASFNLHETFFGQRFAMTLADGSAAHSGCVAFGLERWVLAAIGQLGHARAAALAAPKAR
jgi:seryl-tRNA synthetase